MGDPTPTPDPTPDPAPQPTPTPDPTPVPDPSKQPPWGAPENFDAEKAWELIQNLRTKEGRDAELQAKLDQLEQDRKQQMDALAKALGLKSDDTPPDPAKLAEQITAEQGKTADAEARAAAAERTLAVYLAAGAHEANPALLVDSSSFMASIKDVDHTDAAALGEAIKKAVEANPVLKAVPTTPPFPGGPRPPAPPARPGSLDEAIAARLSSQSR